MIPAEFDSVAVGVAQVTRFAYSVVRRALNGHAVIEQALERAGEIASSRVENREVIESRAPGQRLRRTLAGPGVERDVMMITTRREEDRALSIALRDTESQHVAIKLQRAFEIR